MSIEATTTTEATVTALAERVAQLECRLERSEHLVNAFDRSMRFLARAAKYGVDASDHLSQVRDDQQQMAAMLHYAAQTFTEAVDQ